MRVAHINLAKGIRGGENQTLALVKELTSRPNETHILICRKGSDLETRAREAGVAILPVTKPFLFSAGKLRDFDLVHVHEGRSTYLALAADLLFGIPYLMTRRIPNSPHDKWVTRLAYGRAACIVSLSRKIDSVMRAFSTSDCFEVIPSIARKLTADDVTVAELKNRFEGKFVIGHIGALSDHHKNQSLIIEAARELQDHSDIVFLLLGNGKDEAMLKARASGLDNVIFEGYRTNTADYYSLFDLFVYPSKEEGLGSAILEAFGFSLPVIAADVDGIPDIVKHEATGLLIDPSSVDELQQAILRLYKEDTLRETLARNGNAFTAEFTAPVITARYVELYKRLQKGNQ